MTIAAVWTDDNCQSLWAVSDTRLTAARSGSVRLSDNASKLLSIPYRCRQISPNPEFELSPFFWGSFGFAFAGNSSAALLTATTATTLFAMLTAPRAKLPPKLCELASGVTKIAKHFCKESLAAHNGNHVGVFEAIVFGHCAWSKSGEVYHLKPSLSSGEFRMECELVNLVEDANYIAIGSGKDRLDEEVINLKMTRAERIPQRALHKIIDDDNKLDVGGFMSLGISQPFEFRPYWVAEPVNIGSPAAWRSYNGFDVDELGAFGACVVGGIGMVRATS